MMKKEVTARIGHISIEVTNIQQSRAFYSALLKGLGCKVIRDSDDVVGFSHSNFQIWLGQSRPPRITRKAPSGEEHVVADHIAILVDCKEVVNAIARCMDQKGYDSLFPPNEYPEHKPGYYAVSYCDPDNYVIEIFSDSK
ncbi:MAG: VOC family protein [Candidatus Bathyarchaeota archaeon]|nr:MAG: VOC family protein [Candidatus Bathyarchaeota archaeon]